MPDPVVSVHREMGANGCGIWVNGNWGDMGPSGAMETVGGKLINVDLKVRKIHFTMCSLNYNDFFWKVQASLSQE